MQENARGPELRAVAEVVQVQVPELRDTPV